MKKSLSEFDLIYALTKNAPSFHTITKGIGDDAAVIQLSPNTYQLITVDTLVENDHFNLSWSSAFQIGKKAMEVNVSDIAAMGGIPQYALISLVITSSTSEIFLQQLYKGIHTVCKKYKISLIGGDTTHGDILMISITLLGETNKKNLSLRSSAKQGDLICVTGKVGGSSAGYFALKKGIPLNKLPAYVKKRHLEPVSRLDASKIVAPYVHAMIDVSDGVGSEVRHIAQESKKGAMLYEEKIPVDKEVFALEKKIGLASYHCALSGGEDFELVFTLSEKNIKELQKKFRDFSIIGKITKNEKELFIISQEGRKREIPGGWDHVKKLKIKS